MKLLWTMAAQRNLKEIHHQLTCRYSPETAEKLTDRIIDKAVQLIKFPELGQRVLHPEFVGARQILSLPYRIIYRVHDEEIQILNVIHGARNSPPFE